jgi:quercetin dioxygenase-like cupin family protein
MIRLLQIILLTGYLAGQVCAADKQSQLINEESLQWHAPASIHGLSYAWAPGAEKNPGLCLLRTKLAAGTKIPPHSHPDQRNSTVLSGTLYVGFGRQFDVDKLVAVEQGQIYIIPAGTTHFIMAMDGDVTYQESGIGPTATVIFSKTQR